jgi:hypothetical protein
MKRSITCVGMTLGSAALIALGAGCSHESRPTQTPTAGTTSPTFESNVPPSPAPAAPQPPGSDMGTMNQPTPGGTSGQIGQAPSGTQGEPAAPSGGTRWQQEQPSTTAGGGENERQLCDAVANGAKLHVEDVQNGVSIVIVPKAGHDLATVRDNARRLETSMRQLSGVEANPAAGESCGLYSIVKLPSVTTALTEGPSSVRILITSPNPTETKDLRRMAREQVTNLSKGTSPAPGQKR